MTLKIIGAGFGRTGTLSFKAALEELGFGPCYHMLEVMDNPGHAVGWHQAIDNPQMDWPGLLSNYRAAVDWPACHFWRQLADAYPDAKVILTHRDADRWYDSISETILPAMLRPATDPDRHAMAAAIIMQRTFSGRLGERDFAKRVFEDHIKTVQAAIPAARLLTYEVSEGWQPLCEFLEVPVPDTPYPRLNSTAEFRVMTGLDEA